MANIPRILLLDDEPDILDVYQEFLRRLPCKPYIATTTSGARALALLDTEPFDLLITDIKMPRIDGLQVISIVRRKFPNLRVVTLTALKDEGYRSRAYSLGVDLYWMKPTCPEEMGQFRDCIESLITSSANTGFRGVQSKSLVDLVQWECLSRSSSLLKITMGTQEGRIWIQDGEIIDAVIGDEHGEAAFHRMFGWKHGHFELLPPEPGHKRTIHNSAENLLLNSAQAHDEKSEVPPARQEDGAATDSLSALRYQSGVEFVVALTSDKKAEGWGLANLDASAQWMQQALGRLEKMGEKLQAGDLVRVHAEGKNGRYAVGIAPKGRLLVGFKRDIAQSEIPSRLDNLLQRWV